MKSKLFTIAVLSFIGFTTNAQVGINTNQAQATLDVVGAPTVTSKLDGIIAPRITGNQLRAKNYTSAQTGAMVYVTAADSSPAGQTLNVTASGYYYFDGAVWVKTSSGSSTGTVTNFSSGNLSPLFTTSVTNPTTSPSLAFNLTNAPANSIFGNNSGSAAAPAYFSTSALPINGDVTGTLGSTTVVNINGSPLGTTTTATNGQVLTFNGTNWVPATPAAEPADWHIDGNTDVTASGVKTAVGNATSSVSNLKYLGTQNANDVVFAAAGTIRGVIDNTNGSFTGGGTDGNSYFMWGSQNTAATTGSPTHTFNNAIIAGYKNALTNSNIIPSTGANATVILGKENSINYNGVAVGYKNSVSTALVIGNGNSATSGAVFGYNNITGSGSYLIFGRDFNSLSASNPNTGLLTSSNVYANEYHYFQSQDGTASGLAKFAKVAVNTVPLATQVTDIKVSKAVQFVSDATLTCDSVTEGAIRYNSNGTTGNFQGCRRTGASTFAWAQLN